MRRAPHDGLQAAPLAAERDQAVQPVAIARSGAYLWAPTDAPRQSQALHQRGADLVGGDGGDVAAVGLAVAIVGAAEREAGNTALALVHLPPATGPPSAKTWLPQPCSLPPPEPGRSVRPKSLSISVTTLSSRPALRLASSNAATAWATSTSCASCVVEPLPR